MFTYIKNNWKLLLLVIFAILIGWGFCFLYFRNQPEKIKEVEKIVEKIVYKDRIVEKLIDQKDVKVDQVKERIIYRYITKAGTPVEKIIEKEGKVVVKKEVEYKDKIVEKEVFKDKEVIKEKIVNNVKDWNISAYALINIPLALEDRSIGINQLHPAIIGLNVSRRIVGGFKLGLYLDTLYSIGLSAGMDF